MSGLSKTMLGLAMASAVVLGATQASAAWGNKEASGKEDVSALKAQVAELQGKIAVLEQKLSSQNAQIASQAVTAVPQPSASGYDPYDPFAVIDAMEQRMQSMMGPYGMGAGFMSPARGRSVMFDPDYDIKESGQSYVITFDMPGMDKAKINVEVKDGVLHVSGERSSDSQESQGNKVYRQQRSFGYFSRSIPLPKDAKAESVQAKYDNGVLIVTVDRKEPAQKKDASQKVEVK